MKKHLLSTALGITIGLGATVAQAVPSLQLTILGGEWVCGALDSNGKCTDQTTYSLSKSFTLVALVDPSTIDETQTFYISAALVTLSSDPVDTGGSFGSFEFGSQSVSVTADMAYGTPPLASLGDNFGDLPGHGIYDTFFAEFAFTFDLANITDEINVQDYTPSSMPEPVGGDGKSLLYATFNVDLTGLAEAYAIHFDLYSQTVRDCLDKDNELKNNCDPVAIVDEFAPFSHDAQGSSTSTGIITSNGTAPEPGTLTLFGIGILGGLFAHRRRRQMRA